MQVCFSIIEVCCVSQTQKQIKKKETKILGKWQVPLEMSNESQCTEVDFLLYRPLVGVELLNFEQ